MKCWNLSWGSCHDTALPIVFESDFVAKPIAGYHAAKPASVPWQVFDHAAQLSARRRPPADGSSKYE